MIQILGTGSKIVFLPDPNKRIQILEGEEILFPDSAKL